MSITSHSIVSLRREKNEDNDLLFGSFATGNNEQYWKTCLQAYFLDMNQILCPYELQGSCKAQNCI